MLILSGSKWKLTASAQALGTATPGLVTSPAIDTSAADLIVAVGTTLGSQVATISDFSDNYGNTWTLVADARGAVPVSQSFCYCACIGAPVIGGVGHTISWNSSYGTLNVLAFRGSRSNPVDKNTFISGTAPTYAQVIAAPPLTPARRGSLLVSAVTALPDVISIDDPKFQVLYNSPTVGGTRFGMAVAYSTLERSTPVEPVWTLSAVATYGASAFNASFFGK